MMLRLCTSGDEIETVVWLFDCGSGIVCVVLYLLPFRVGRSRARCTESGVSPLRVCFVSVTRCLDE